MKISAKLKVKRQRPFSAHHMLIGAARMAMEVAKAKKPGWFYNNLMAITFSALSVEAMCNSIGDRLIPEWKDFESSSPLGKLRLLCDHFKIKYDNGKEPWTSARWLARFRNDIAHAKPELLLEEEIITRQEYDNKRGRGDQPISKLEGQVTHGNAARAVRTAEAIKEILCAKIPPEEALGLRSDGWFGSASAHDDP